MEKIIIKNLNGNLTYTLPQGMTGVQFSSWKEKNKDLIKKVKANTDEIIEVNLD